MIFKLVTRLFFQAENPSLPLRRTALPNFSRVSWYRHRRRKLIWPTDWRVITQYFTYHTGVDIDGDYNTVSHAAADGVVIYSGWRRGYGMTVEINHGNGIVTRYAHNSKFYVSGDVVSAGQTIAQTGSTGRSTGTHLHFEVIRTGGFKIHWIGLDDDMKTTCAQCHQVEEWNEM